jgi:hypothetical protein
MEKFVEIIVSEVKGKIPLDVKNQKKLRKLVEHLRDGIVRKWVDFFVYNRQITSEVITQKID